MQKTIRVAILEDHQSVIDGYLHRLSQFPDVEIVATAAFGENLEPLLQEHTTDVLILDIEVPTSPDNLNPYPILHLLPKLFQKYPGLNVLVISMHNQSRLIKAVMDSGASGYILKDDRSTIQELANIVVAVANGGIYLSQQAYQKIITPSTGEPTLTGRQLEVLSLCAAYPDATTMELADRLKVANSTVRNLLSEAYLRLGVRNKTAAIAKARALALITPYPARQDF